MSVGAKPDVVLSAIKEDLKRRYRFYTEAAEALGFNSVQRLSNILRRLKEKESYMNDKQASIFADKLGYSRDFLMHGWGTLMPSDAEYASFLDDLASSITIVDTHMLDRLDENQTWFLLQQASEIIDASMAPELKKAWRALLKNDKDGYSDAADEIKSKLESRNVPFHFSGGCGYFFLNYTPRATNHEPEETQ